jgi:hypothetical protein
MSSHPPVPLVFGVCRTECKGMYEQLLLGLGSVALSVLGFPADIKIATCSMDHSFSIFDAVKEYDDAIQAIDCSTHMTRGCKKNKHRLVDKEYCE